jgi:hypothetical protein
VMRATSRLSSIWSSMACLSGRDLEDSMSSSFSACATVRGKPSRMKLGVLVFAFVAVGLYGCECILLPVGAFLVGVQLALDHADHDVV